MRDAAMKVELTPDAAQWVEAALASGRFVTAEDAVRYAINRAKRAELREMLEATEAEGGIYSTEDVRRQVRDHLDRLAQTPQAGRPARALARIAAHIERERGSREAAEAFVDKLAAYCEHIASLPAMMGRLRPELRTGYPSVPAAAM